MSKSKLFKRIIWGTLVCVAITLVSSLILVGLLFKPGSAYIIFGLTGWSGGFVAGLMIGGGLLLAWTILNVILYFVRKPKLPRTNNSTPIDKTGVGGSIRKGWDNKK